MARPHCAAICSRDIDCGEIPPPLAACTDACVTRSAWVLRADAIAELASCYVEVPCAEPTEPCIAAVDILDVHREFEEGCRPKLTECALPVDQVELACDVDGVILLSFRLYTPSVVAGMIACFEGKCDAIQGCYDQVLADHRSP
jgi:hypothetical protein